MAFIEQMSTNRRHKPQRGSVRCVDCEARRFSMCGALDVSELEALDKISHTTSFAPKSLLFDQWELAGNVFNLTEGMVQLYKSLPDGRRQIIGFALVGDFLGLALMDHYGVTAEALTMVKVCCFSRLNFLSFVDERPHLLRRLYEFAGHELNLAQDQMLLLGRRTAEEKVATFLLNLWTRYSRIGAISITLPLPMSRQDIADHLGLTIETVSRTLTRLARERVILIVPGGVRLLEVSHLERLAAR